MNYKGGENVDEKLDEQSIEARRKYYRDYYSRNKDKYKKSNESYWKKKVEKESQAKE